MSKRTEVMTHMFIVKHFHSKPCKEFVSGVQDSFGFIECNLLRSGIIMMIPLIRNKRDECIEDMNRNQGKQDYQDYLLGFIAVLDHCLKEH